jgi:hypothetical protein
MQYVLARKFMAKVLVNVPLIHSVSGKLYHEKLFFCIFVARFFYIGVNDSLSELKLSRRWNYVDENILDQAMLYRVVIC